jgi:hypothetical protein
MSTKTVVAFGRRLILIACSEALPRGMASTHSIEYFRRKQKDRPQAVSVIAARAVYILSSVFFIFVDLDLAIFFLLILSFDMSPFDMLSLWAAGPVVAGLFVSVD